MTLNKLNEWSEWVPFSREAGLRKVVVESNLANTNKGSEYHACVIPSTDALIVTCSDKATLQAILDSCNT